MTREAVTVLGLGTLGLPIAVALVRAGYRVSGVDPSAERRALATKYGFACSSPETYTREMAGGAVPPWLITVLPDNDSFSEALKGRPGQPGFLDLLSAGHVHLCIGTIGLDLVEKISSEHQARGQFFVAVPVFGRPDEAWDQDMTAVLGASEDFPSALAQIALEMVACIAPRVHRVASPSAAMVIKLSGNLLIATAIAAMTEAFTLARRHGANAETVHEIVTGKLFKGPVYEGVGRSIAHACHAESPQAGPPGFTVQLGLKDLSLIEQAATSVGVDLALGAAAKRKLEQAVVAGHASRDWAELPMLLPPPAVSGFSDTSIS
jgi:3-hydroxyisobutyrate dehydrogenase-like beta-hydroxyacid dehydrogenase